MGVSPEASHVTGGQSGGAGARARARGAYTYQRGQPAQTNPIPQPKHANLPNRQPRRRQALPLQAAAGLTPAARQPYARRRRRAGQTSPTPRHT